MVLKRLFVTALSALGLGALAAGPAFGQTESNVPAPDGFNNNIACAANNAMYSLDDPSTFMGAMAGMRSDFDQVIKTNAGAGDYRLIVVGGTGADGDETLIDVIPANIVNCGAGTAFTSMDASYNLAKGYTEVLTKYQQVVAARAALKSAQDALPSGQTTSPAVVAAQSNLTTAENELTALSMGPIYMAGIMEWDAKGAVDMAVTGWNSALGAVGTSGTYLDAKSSLDAASFADYRAITLGDYGTTAAGTFTPGSTGGMSNFNAGTGQFEFDLGDPTTWPAAGADTVTNIQTLLDTAEATVKAINDDIDEATAARLPVLQGYLAQAEAERNFVQHQLNRAYADSAIAPLYSAFNVEKAELATAETTLRSAVAARVAASKAVQGAFQGADTYLDQNVKRHEYLVAQDPNDDDLAEDLQEARDLKEQFDTYFMSPAAGTAFNGDNPAGDLLNALLKPSVTNDNDTPGDTADDFLEDGEGNDGQALVDAVSHLHDNTVVNNNEITTLKGHLTDSSGNLIDLEGVSGVGQKVTELEAGLTATDIALDDNGNGPIARNKANIAQNTSDIKGINDAFGSASQVELQLGADGTCENVSGAAATIACFRTITSDNKEASSANTTWIETNGAQVGLNKTLSETNRDNLATLTGRVDGNARDIMGLRDDVSGLRDQMDVVRAGVAASMALAGMPAINGRGISIGVGSYDGESAFAVGFQIQGEMASFKVGVTSAGGETGASAGVGFQF